MSILFAEIYDGIRAVRASKGVCEKDILNYVQERAGGCMKVGNVLRTLRALNKLVEQGVLIKCCNRYKFPPKSYQREEEECEEEEEEECEEEDEPEPEDCESCSEEDDDDDDDDDDSDDCEDDEEDDDNFFDDDDQSCDNETLNSEGPEVKPTQKSVEPERKCPESTPARPTVKPDCERPKKTKHVTYMDRTVQDGHKKSSGKRVAKPPKSDKTILNQKGCKPKNGKITYCATDFDSMPEEMEMEMTSTPERDLDISNTYSTSTIKTRPHCSNMNLEGHVRYRSRSPIRGRKREFSLMNQDSTDKIGFTVANKGILLETNSKEDVEDERKNEPVNDPLRDSPVREIKVEVMEDEEDRKSILGPVKTESRSGGSSVPETKASKMSKINEMSRYPSKVTAGQTSSLESRKGSSRKCSLCSICEKRKKMS